MLNFNIAIDGPAGAGKSTAAKIVAERLHYLYIDTGAMYRALTWELLRRRACLEDEAKLKAELKDIEIVFRLDDNGDCKVFCNGVDVSGEIRSPEISKAVSIVAVKQPVRAHMVKLQQEMAKKGKVIMDGRDIGTVVIPEAAYKFYLTADVIERAKRRFLELQKMGHIVFLPEVQNDIETRDKIDSEREIGPLRKAPDAIYIDTTDLRPEEVAEIIVYHCIRRPH